MNEYHCDLKQIAAGGLKKFGDNYMFQGKTRYFIMDKGDLVPRDKIKELPHKQTDHTTSSGRYQICIRSALEEEVGTVSVVRLADPNNWVNSIELANATAKVYGSNLRVINIRDYVPQDKKLEGRRLWLPEFQKQWGRLDDSATYLLAGFENLDEEQLSIIFDHRYFESYFESYQERRGFWEKENYNHKLAFLITGKAEEALEKERNITTNYGSGTIQNFLERVHKTILYCVVSEP